MFGPKFDGSLHELKSWHVMACAAAGALREQRDQQGHLLHGLEWARDDQARARLSANLEAERHRASVWELLPLDSQHVHQGASPALVPSICLKTLCCKVRMCIPNLNPLLSRQGSIPPYPGACEHVKILLKRNLAALSPRCHGSCSCPNAAWYMTREQVRERAGPFQIQRRMEAA